MAELSRQAEGQITILVVEDEAMLRDLIKESLSFQGFKVLMAANGDEALKLAAEYAAPIDVFLTDVALPGMSGPQVASGVQELRPGTPVLYMSGHLESSIEHHSVHEPGVEFLQKRFTPTQLVAKLREILGAAPRGRD